MSCSPLVTYKFIPPIPVRRNSDWLSDTNEPALYALVQPAVRKLLGMRYKKLIKQLKEATGLESVQYGDILVSVPLNTKVKEAKKYLYKFFNSLYLQTLEDMTYDQYIDKFNTAKTAYETWLEWNDENKIEFSLNDGELKIKEEPPRPIFPEPPVKIFSFNTNNFRIGINFRFATKVTRGGLYKQGAKKGDIWIESVEGVNVHFPTMPPNMLRVNVYPYRTEKTSDVQLILQENIYTHTILKFSHLSHSNYIYYEHGVSTMGTAVLANPENKNFFVPLVPSMAEKLGLVNLTQIGVSYKLLVFNAYKITKEKWYQTGAFKIVLTIATIVIAAYTGMIDFNTMGILGSAGTVGATLGLTGLAGIIAGSLANTLASAIVTALIMRGSTSLFGDKLGKIIGIIASVYALKVGTDFQKTGSFDFNVAKMMPSLSSASDIMQLSSNAIKGLNMYMENAIEKETKKTEDIFKEYSAKISEYENDPELNQGLGANAMTASLVQEALATNLAEPADVFLTRTLMTGSDIVDFTLDFIHNFATISLPKPRLT